MENKEIKVVPPDGYVIDKENSTFDCIKFKPVKNKLPKTWEEFCKNYSNGKEWFISTQSEIVSIDPDRRRSRDSDKNLLPTKELAEAMLALCQLIQLRDCYNDGWKPDWTLGVKYVIMQSGNTVCKYHAWGDNRILVFKTEEIRDQFFENFKDLIEVAKPLL